MGATKQKSSAAKNVLIFFIVFLILEMLIIFGISTVFKNKDVTPSIAGYSLYLMDSDKMEDKIPQGSLVIAANGTPSVEKIGQAVVCEDVANIGTSVFWLCDVTSKGETVDGVVYTVCQESDPEKRYEVKSGNIVGVASSYYTTAGSVITFVSSTFGMIVCAVVPLFLLVLIELIIAVAAHSSSKEEDEEEEDEIEEDKNVTLDDFLFGGENESEQIAKHLQRQDTMIKKNNDIQESDEEILEAAPSLEEKEMSYYEKASKLLDGEDSGSGGLFDDKDKSSAENPVQRRQRAVHTRPVHSGAKPNASLEDLMKLMEQEQNKLKEQLDKEKNK